MPRFHFRLLKTSLLLGLFVFIDLSCFTFYCFILCFILCNTWVLYWYAIGNTTIHQKCIDFWLNFIKATPKAIHIYMCWEQFLYFCSKRSLQKTDYSAKQSEHGLKVRSGYLNIQKSLKKQSQALKIYSTRPLFPIFQVRYCSFFNLNPAL